MEAGRYLDVYTSYNNHAYARCMAERSPLWPPTPPLPFGVRTDAAPGEMEATIHLQNQQALQGAFAQVEAFITAAQQRAQQTPQPSSERFLPKCYQSVKSWQLYFLGSLAVENNWRMRLRNTVVKVVAYLQATAYVLFIGPKTAGVNAVLIALKQTKQKGVQELKALKRLKGQLKTVGYQFRAIEEFSKLQREYLHRAMDLLNRQQYAYSGYWSGCVVTVIGLGTLITGAVTALQPVVLAGVVATVVGLYFLSYTAYARYFGAESQRDDFNALRQMKTGIELFIPLLAAKGMHVLEAPTPAPGPSPSAPPEGT